MKKIYYYLIAAVLILVVLGIQQCRFNKMETKYQMQSVELSTIKDSVETYKSKNGELTIQGQYKGINQFAHSRIGSGTITIEELYKQFKQE